MEAIKRIVRRASEIGLENMTFFCFSTENFDRSKDPNPNACAKWFEAAKARKVKQWEKLVNDTVKNS